MRNKHYDKYFCFVAVVFSFPFKTINKTNCFERQLTEWNYCKLLLALFNIQGSHTFWPMHFSKNSLFNANYWIRRTCKNHTNSWLFDSESLDQKKYNFSFTLFFFCGGGGGGGISFVNKIKYVLVQCDSGESGQSDWNTTGLIEKAKPTQIEYFFFQLTASTTVCFFPLKKQYSKSLGIWIYEALF